MWPHQKIYIDRMQSFSPASNWWHSVTARECMKHGKRTCFFTTKFFGYLMWKIYRRCFPVPKATQISVFSRKAAVETARTNTYVSTVRSIILWCPLFDELTARRSILGSTSSCVYGARDHSTFWSLVAYTSLSLETFSIAWCAKKLNSSVLLSGNLKNSLPISWYCVGRCNKLPNASSSNLPCGWL